MGLDPVLFEQVGWGLGYLPSYTNIYIYIYTYIHTYIQYTCTMVPVSHGHSACSRGRAFFERTTFSIF